MVKQVIAALLVAIVVDIVATIAAVAQSWVQPRPQPPAVAPVSRQWVVPVPSITIYPRDVIREDMIEDKAYPERPVTANNYAITRDTLVGKVARVTLLPGHPIPSNTVELPKLVTLGAQVRIVFENSGITIVGYGSALQAGAEGDLIRVRNSDSGLTISGKVQPDGSVRVGDT